MRIRGKAPLRLSLAGGGTDFEEIFNEHGGMVVSTTIDKFCHMSLETRIDKKIYINDKYNPRDTEKLAYQIIDKISPDFGFNLTYYNDVLPGSGLGNSSSFTALLVTLLSELQGKKYDDRELVKITHNIENKINYGGWQDQFATVMGGFNFMEFEKHKKTVYPIRLKYRTLCELEEHLVLYSIGPRPRESGDIQSKKYKEMTEEYLQKMLKTKELANEIKHCLLNNKVSDIGKLLHKTWELKRDKSTTNKNIDGIYQLALNNGATGGKVMGAGQGGHMLFFCTPEKRNNLIEVLNHAGGEVKTFGLWQHGVETW